MEIAIFFFVDVGGNTGLNLFDPLQPTLYYGVLSSQADLDVVALSRVQEMRKLLGVSRIHSKELGNDALAKIAPAVLTVQRKFRVRFDFYNVKKADHAVMCFFDQVFDSGMNDAVSYTNYWSPLRYGLLLELASIFDEEQAKKAWEARIEGDDAKGAVLMREVCLELLTRLKDVRNDGARERIGNGLTWAAKNPEAISYNASNKHLSKKEKKLPSQQISPNIIGFQFVMKGIGQRLQISKVKEASRIVVDQQAEFNHAQNTLAKFYADAGGLGDFVSGPGMPVMTFDDMPTTPIEFRSSEHSAGLELIDVLLWTHRRFVEKKPLASQLRQLVEFNAGKMLEDEISLNGIWNRWRPFLTTPGNDLSAIPADILVIARQRQAAEHARIQAAVAATGTQPL